MNNINKIINKIQILDIIIFILIIAVLYLLFRQPSTNENFADTTIPKETIDAINNLGLISKSIITGRNQLISNSDIPSTKGDLIIPANIIMDGNASITGNLLINNKNLMTTITTWDDNIRQMINDENDENDKNIDYLKKLNDELLKITKSI